MTELTQGRPTKRRAGDQFADPVKASAVIYMGALVALDATGFAVRAATAVGLKARGVATQDAVNTGGADGALMVAVEKGVFAFRNDGSINRTHIEGTAYIVDDNVVSATDGGSTRSAAGKIVDIADGDVWVHIN